MRVGLGDLRQALGRGLAGNFSNNPDWIALRQPLFDATLLVLCQPNGRLLVEQLPATFEQRMDQLYLLAHRAQQVQPRDWNPVTDQSCLQPLRISSDKGELRKRCLRIRGRLLEVGQQAWQILEANAPAIAKFLINDTSHLFVSPQGAASRWLFEWLMPAKISHAMESGTVHHD